MAMLMPARVSPANAAKPEVHTDLQLAALVPNLAADERDVVFRREVLAEVLGEGADEFVGLLFGKACRLQPSRGLERVEENHAAILHASATARAGGGCCAGAGPGAGGGGVARRVVA